MSFIRTRKQQNTRACSLIKGDMRRVLAQDPPFDLSIWYIAKTIPTFFGIEKIRDVELTCIFRPGFTLYTYHRR